MTTEELCIYCNSESDGNCESCNAPLCYDHDSKEWDDVMECVDAADCSKRIEARAKESK